MANQKLGIHIQENSANRSIQKQQYNIYQEEADKLKQGDYVIIDERILPIQHIEKDDDGMLSFDFQTHPNVCPAFVTYKFTPDTKLTCAWYLSKKLNL